MTEHKFIYERFNLTARALRVPQWTKNAVVFAAFIFALGDPGENITVSHIVLVIPAALLFCLVSSGIYLLNDVMDRESDRLHPVKRLRPVASGEITIRTALIMSLILVAAGLSAGWMLSPPFFTALAGYTALQVAYTSGLKKIAFVDVFIIAGGFVLRAMAGALVIGVAISPWLLLCALLLALFLALCKRRSEKTGLGDGATVTRASMLNYEIRLLDILIGIISAATIVSYAIYTLWPDTVEKFGTTKLALTIPFVIFGIFRYLNLVYRHEQGERPEKILMTDIPLIIDIALYGLTVITVLLLS